MADRQAIEALRTRYQTTQQAVAIAEKEVSTAEEGLATTDEALKGLGFDPTGDLDAQRQAKEAELDGILDSVEQLIAESESKLTPTAGD